jgi:hypothetical protein
MSTHMVQPGPRERDTLPEIKLQSGAVLVRDVVRQRLHELPPSERMLRVPYDLFNPVGPVRLEDGLILYMQGGQIHTGRFAESTLGDAHPAERVLLRLQDEAAEGHQWWLCEVQYPAQ